MDILLAGGAGYIGSVIYNCLVDNGHNPIIVDSLKYGTTRIEGGVKMYTGDIGNRKLIEQIFDENPSIELCIHSAEISSPNMSVTEPFAYYHGNVVKSMGFFKILNDLNCDNIIFSSSAAVYNEVAGQVVTESSPVKPKSPYGRAKHMTEIILRDFCQAYGMNGVILRNFSPIGVDPKLRTSMNSLRPYSILSNLIKVVEGKLPYFEIYGGNWDTRDGTCIRDFVHVWDMAEAYVKAVKMFGHIIQVGKDQDTNVITMNIGSGNGITIKEFVSAFENLTGEKVKIKICEKRAGDSAGTYADIRRAKSVLDWQPKLPVEEAILDVLNLFEKYNK